MTKRDLLTNIFRPVLVLALVVLVATPAIVVAEEVGTPGNTSGSGNIITVTDDDNDAPASPVRNTGAGEVGTPGNTSNRTSYIELENPLGDIDSIPDLVRKFINVILILGVPVVAFYIIFSGLQFVLARGNEKKLETARKRFMWTMIGALILLSAWTLAQVLQSTVSDIGGQITEATTS